MTTKIKNIRLKNYDYSANGFYFVTISTNYRNSYLIQYRDLIVEILENLNKISGVSVDHYTIMPNHLHLILILNNCHLNLGEVIRKFKALTTKKAGTKLWQPNYYEHVIRNEIALLKIREYIQNNPLVEKIDFKEFYKKSMPDKSGNYKSE